MASIRDVSQLASAAVTHGMQGLPVTGPSGQVLEAGSSEAGASDDSSPLLLLGMERL